MIQAALLDMDGVIIDSERFMCDAAIAMFAERGLKVQADDFLPFVGAGEDRYIGGVAEKYGVTLDTQAAKGRAYAIYAEIIRNKLKPLPGVHAFIDRAKGAGLSLGLVTSADREKVTASLNEIEVAEDTFDSIVTGLDVARKKPFPDIYLRAAILLGLAPTSCLVVEDSVNGIKAAKSAGARCLALTTSFPETELTEADWMCRDLSDVPEDALNW